MFIDSNCREIKPEEIIFPLLTHNPETKIWKCLGTGFFIQKLGGFVTARHVFVDSVGENEPTLYGVQTTKSGEHHLRVVAHIVTHTNADLAVGMLGHRRLPGVNIQPEETACFQINPAPLKIGDDIKTFAFPLTETVEESNGSFEFIFEGIWSSGIIIDYYEQGVSLLKNKCYQTSMSIKSGASGGPVLKNGLVVGINSTGYDLLDGEDPISFITPIELILEMSVPTKAATTSIKQLIEKGFISSK